MRRERFDKMNVVPFIDIVLVLLVIVLATSTFIQNKTIKVDLPSSSSKVDMPKKSINISVDSSGKYFYDKTLLSFDEIKLKIDELNPTKDIISLNMDKSSMFKYFIDLMDILKQKGFKNISIVTKK